MEEGRRWPGDPAAHLPHTPVYVIPPHCLYFATVHPVVPPLAALVAATTVFSVVEVGGGTGAGPHGWAGDHVRGGGMAGAASILKLMPKLLAL